MKFSQTKTLAFSLLLFVNHGSAQTDLQTTEKTLDIIAKFSMSMCGNPALQGSSKSVEVSAAAKTEVSKLVKQLAEIKLETAAKFQSTDYQGLLQQDLVQVLKDSANCKQSIFNDLKDRLWYPKSTANALLRHPDPPRRNLQIFGVQDGHHLKLGRHLH